MPRNNTLKPVVLPMPICFGEEVETEFKNNLDAISIKLIDAPSMGQLRTYLPQFLEATWASDPSTSTYHMSLKEKDQLIRDALEGRALPTALETIGLTFLIEGISLQEVTHILRYRTASFSADCSGDKWWHKKAALVPNAIIQNKEMYERYQHVVELSKQLYADMIDTKMISIMDARYILPRCLETFYYMRINLKDAIHFIKQRIDRQIQPETDNVIAYQMYVQIMQHLPITAGLINIDTPSQFYATMARSGKATNLYHPEEINDIFEWNEKDFIYNCTRADMNGVEVGYNHFAHILDSMRDKINTVTASAKRTLEAQYEIEEEERKRYSRSKHK
jgi:thymidylate synthase ThyX